MKKTNKKTVISAESLEISLGELFRAVVPNFIFSKNTSIIIATSNGEQRIADTPGTKVKIVAETIEIETSEE